MDNVKHPFSAKDVTPTLTLQPDLVHSSTHPESMTPRLNDYKLCDGENHTNCKSCSVTTCFSFYSRILAEYTGAVAVHVGLLAIEWNPFGDFPGEGRYEKILLKYRDKDDCYFMS